MSKTLAIIVGHQGQDGRLLWERLVREGLAVIGIGRGSVACSGLDWTIPVDITNRLEVESLIRVLKPREVYHLAAYHASAEGPPVDDADVVERSFAVHVASLANFLCSIEKHSRETRLFYAASSHIFGEPRVSPQDESCPLEPQSVYGISKAAGTHLCRRFRRERGLFVSVGILFNHESPYRPATFLSRRVIDGVLAVASGEEDSRDRRPQRQRRLGLGAGVCGRDVPNSSSGSARRFRRGLGARSHGG